MEKQDQESSPTLQLLDVKSMKNLVETVQEFYLTLGIVLKHFNDKITEIIGMNNVDNISPSQFGKLCTIFDDIIHYFEADLKLIPNLNAWIVSNKEGIKKPLLNLIPSISDKITIAPIQLLKSDYERSKKIC